MLKKTVKAGQFAVLDEGFGECAGDLDEEQQRLLRANLHAAARAIRAHADYEVSDFEVKASPDELHVKRA